MKNYLSVICLLITLFFVGCSGSDVYQGNWKATDATGKKFSINFEPKAFSIQDSLGKITKYNYTQNSVKIENSVKSYGIKLSDGRFYNIIFPIAGDTKKGVISTGNNELLYTISRNDYLTEKDLYKLN